MKIQVNGKHIVTQANNLSELFYEQQIDITCIATAFNGVFVPKNQYDSQCLEEGCRLEVLSPMQGG
ncbi:sulfur carrier protein ThiS [Candidatus Pantoea carbekii]|uniref:sulfur carrier protein ThiS n=1 Tax=Candidatus Pantoea carbekii TaxID=1235990 RepID=UPI0006187A78|nr:sulfur carrier protein ThiS [Candidatus Pantoea carbekii]AKC32621.1 thiamine biosynthesis protein ThiS [Candidatus Pantoea carbekii]